MVRDPDGLRDDEHVDTKSNTPKKDDHSKESIVDRVEPGQSCDKEENCLEENGADMDIDPCSDISDNSDMSMSPRSQVRHQGQPRTRICT